MQYSLLIKSGGGVESVPKGSNYEKLRNFPSASIFFFHDICFFLLPFCTFSPLKGHMRRVAYIPVYLYKWSMRFENWEKSQGISIENHGCLGRNASSVLLPAFLSAMAN